MTEKREQFLSDIITTAIEGGIGYWSQCSQYQWTDSDGSVRVSVGQRAGEGTRAAIHELDDDEADYRDEAQIIDCAVVEKGIQAVTKGEVSVNARIRKSIIDAGWFNDAGYLDADDADVVVQAGLFGEVRYG